MSCYKSALTLTISMILSAGSHAGIINGDFASGDFTGWQTDTDGSTGSANDFSVVNNAAQISVDHWSIPGDDFSAPINDAFFANTLYQELDLTANLGDQLRLSFDWDFTGESASSNAADYFLVGLNDGSGSYYGADGTPGFLVDSVTSFGSDSFSTLLDYNTFANNSGWFLDFQLVVGVDSSGFTDAYGSTLTIDNVSLEAIQSASVPEPGSIALAGLGLVGLLRMKRRL